MTWLLPERISDATEVNCPERDKEAKDTQLGNKPVPCNGDDEIPLLVRDEEGTLMEKDHADLS